MSRREEFVRSIADFLKISLENSVTKEFLTLETGFVIEDDYLDFISHLGNTKTDYKRPLDIFTNAVNSYKSIKFAKFYASAKEQSKKLFEKLENTFRVFNVSYPPEYLEYQHFMQVNEDGTKTRMFTAGEIELLNALGGWQCLFAKRKNSYGLLQQIEDAYAKAVEKKIRASAKALGNMPKVGHQATKLIKMQDEVVERREDKMDSSMTTMMSGVMKKSKSWCTVAFLVGIDIEAVGDEKRYFAYKETDGVKLWVTKQKKLDRWHGAKAYVTTWEQVAKIVNQIFAGEIK